MTAIFLSSGIGGIWFVPVMGAAAGVYMFYRGFQMLKQRRLILNTPSSKIRSAAMGLVEVSGLACGPYTVNAPVTGAPCYYYRTMAWQWKRSGKSSEWQLVADESMHVPFYLDDNTGKLLVNPQGAELDIHRDFHEEFSHSLFSSTLELPGNVAGFLSRNGIGGDEKVKIDEYCIKPKNALFVLGTLGENPGVEVSPTPVTTRHSQVLKANLKLNFALGGANQLANMLESMPGTSVNRSITITTIKNGGPPHVIRLGGNPAPGNTGDMSQQEKISAALIKAGITSPAAWQAAGLAYPGTQALAAPTAEGAAAAVAQAQAQGFEMKPKTVLMKGDHNPAFLISWRSQRDVVKSLGWKAALMVWGGPALTLACVYVLGLRFGIL